MGYTSDTYLPVNLFEEVICHVKIPNIGDLLKTVSADISPRQIDSNPHRYFYRTFKNFRPTKLTSRI